MPRASTMATALPVLLTVGALLGISYGSYHSAKAYYFDPKYARDDYRGVVRYIDARAQPGDVVVLNAPGQIEIFDYYCKSKLPQVPLPMERPIDEKRTEQRLQELASTYKRVWLVLYAVPESDPNGFIEGWLDRQSYKSVNTWFGGIRLCLYAFGGNGTVLQKNDNLRFGDQIKLASCEVGADQFRPGDTVPLTLNWEVLGQVGDRYKVFAHILDRNEAIYGLRDSEPGGGTRITTAWVPGEKIVDRYGISVALGTPPGDYMVEFGMYQPKTGQRLPLKSATGEVVGDRVVMGPIHVDRASSPTDPDLLDMEHKSDAVFDGKLRLLGCSVDAVGQPPDFVDYSGNDVLNITLFWQVVATPTADYLVQVSAGGGQSTQEMTDYLGGGLYPSTQWQPGEVIRDQHRLPLNRLAGDCTLNIALRTAIEQPPVSISPITPTSPNLGLGTLKVKQ